MSQNLITNSIIAGNTALISQQISGSFTDNTNIIQHILEGLLDPILRDNGGPTKTHALLPGSVAIDAGSNQAASEAGLTTDQRGEGSQRIKEGTIDIGALEVQAPFTQVDFRFANSNSRKLNNGEQEQLHENRIWLDETGNYWLEIWLNTPASTNPGIQSAGFNLHYNTSAATAVSIEYGGAFAQNQSGTINQDTGTIENLSAETSRTDVGDDRYTLFARIQFHANMTESTDGERGRHSRASVVNPEPASDIPAFNDLVQGDLQFDYYVQPDNFFAALNLPSNHDFAYDSQLALIDLPGGPVVNQADNETGILNDLDSLVGSRDETEADLLKIPTSTDRDFSAEDDADQFFSDLTEETELLVF
ncbi:choice-of-anchor Q domain-containing protein [Gimesia algae]|uniref:choice-of-anchor Q domain-containing protein n=1 Tax=Gimesia algae TaxID=2527971 RepID=UPI0011A4C6AD|nr:choice-of-anchor Q domain-containing protein [Gimesia algae]